METFIYLKELFEGIEYEGSLSFDGKVKGVCCDTRLLKEGEVFVCIEGERVDGHSFVDEAMKKGAVAVVVEKEISSSLPIIKVRDTRRIYSLLLSNFYRKPSKKLTIVGITGTSGKTTTAYFVHSIIEEKGEEAGLLSTIHYKAKECFSSPYTTPPPHILWQFFHKLVNEGIKYCIMEVSSHALAQKRVEGVDFDVAVFTNITEEHLEYHKDFQDYKAAKAILFHLLRNSEKKHKVAIINADDENAPFFIDAAKGVECVTFGMGKNASFRIQNVQKEEDGMSFEIEDVQIKIHLFGIHNVYNATAAYCVGKALSFKDEDILKGLQNLRSIEGRYEILQREPFWVIIDYSHKVHALECALKTAKTLTNGRVIVVFGCGGGRWKGKREKMGEVAAKNADILFITSDNPRNEAPQRIIEDIIKGAKKGGATFFAIEDREEAIKEAIMNAKEGDVVIICGKGHERVQIIGERKIPFSDKEVARKYMCKE